MGNGKTTLSIPISIRSELNTAMAGISIQASTNMGSVSGCTTDSNGNCNVVFTPPVTSSASYAAININAKELTQSISVNVNPDSTDKLSLQSQSSNLLADGSSSTIITITAYDSTGATVPDGTPISFTLSSQGAGGTISGNSCTSVNGNCQVTYTASTTPGDTIFQVNSYDAANSLKINLRSLPPSSITLSMPSDSIKGDGVSTLTSTANVKNKLGKPVPNSYVTFTVDKGSIQQQYCTTDSSGSCQVTYVAPNLAGTATLSAYTNNNQVSSKASITLTPFTNLTVSFYATPQIGNPVVPAYALNYQYLGKSMTTISISNSGSGTFTGTIHVSIPGWSDTVTQNINVVPGSSTTVNLNPNLNSQAFSNLQAQPANYQLAIQDSKSQTAYQNTYATSITSFNTINWDNNNIIAAWVQPNAPGIHQLLSDAAISLPGKSMIGYSGTYPTGCGTSGISACDQAGTTYLQLKAIYNQLQKNGVHYVNAPNSFSGVQTVYTPAQSLQDGGANCIDGSLVFASAVSAISMQPYIIIVPGHAFVCVSTNSNSNVVECVETTMIGGGSTFAQAYSVGNSEYSKYASQKQLSLVDVNNVLSSGVKSLPS